MKKILTILLILGMVLPMQSYAKGKNKTTKISKTTKSKKKKSSESDVYFNNCSEARASGYSNIRRGEPGYRDRLDRDGDGIACETR